MAARRAFYKDAKVNEKYLQTCEFLGIYMLLYHNLASCN